MEDLRVGKAVSRRYRNRRIGEFLKERSKATRSGYHFLFACRFTPRQPGEKKRYPASTPQVEKLLNAIQGEMSRDELMEALGLRDRMHFAREYLLPALSEKLVEMTIPDKPRSSKQQYRLTATGRKLAGSAGGSARS